MGSEDVARATCPWSMGGSPMPHHPCGHARDLALRTPAKKPCVRPRSARACVARERPTFLWFCDSTLPEVWICIHTTFTVWKPCTFRTLSLASTAQLAGSMVLPNIGQFVDVELLRV